MEEKLREALRDDTSRIGAVSEAAGAVPILRDPLCENEVVLTKFMLVFDSEFHEPHATERWRDLARMPRAAFEAEVEAFSSRAAPSRRCGRWQPTRSRPERNERAGRASRCRRDRGLGLAA
jgi:hypothetical protein